MYLIYMLFLGHPKIQPGTLCWNFLGMPLGISLYTWKQSTVSELILHKRRGQNLRFSSGRSFKNQPAFRQSSGVGVEDRQTKQLPLTLYQGDNGDVSHPQVQSSCTWQAAQAASGPHPAAFIINKPLPSSAVSPSSPPHLGAGGLRTSLTKSSFHSLAQQDATLAVTLETRGAMFYVRGVWTNVLVILTLYF